MENYVGKRLDGRYEIHEIIGVGGMSVVYKAYDNVDDRIVAVKILKEEFTHDEDFVRRFKNESKAIAVLSHPNIVKVYDVSFGDKLQYIVMEYVDGITLKEYIQKQGIITWNDAVFFISQILKALQHAHDKGIVHRDVKPQNIILLPSGNIKVTDFGIARFSRTETKTLTENAIGSVHYISPEQAKGEFTDERADIYSLGVVFYEMLVGRVPFEADSAVSVALMQVNDEPAKLTDINSDIPLGIEQICIHAMQKNPLERYQTATEMLLDLEEVIKNPNATFDYTYYIDNQPTKYVKRDETVNYDAPEKDKEDTDDNEKIERKKNRRKIFAATIMGIILLIAAVIGLISWLSNGLGTNGIKVVDFVALGLPYDDVISNYTEFTFTPDYQQTSEVQPGTILEQSPAAGTFVMEGTQIILKVATSNETISVPNCYDLTEENALKKLEQYELTNVKVAVVNSENVEEGFVVYTEPKAFTAVAKETLITIYVSGGPSTTAINTLTVPDVIGLSQSDAESFLKKSGFTHVVFTAVDSTSPKGTVLSQNPKFSSSQRENSTITLTVSTGIPPKQTITLKIKLPTCIDEHGNYVVDNLIISVDGVHDTNRQVTLDGSEIDIAIVREKGKTVQVVAMLDEIIAQHEFNYTLNEDKYGTVDFTDKSFDYETTTEPTTQPTTEPTTEATTEDTTDEEATGDKPVDNPLDNPVEEPSGNENNNNNTAEPTL